MERPRGSVGLRLDPVAAAVREARRFVRDQLASWGQSHLDDAASVVVSELVTNAVLHARSTVGIELSPTAHGVQLRVSDAMPTQPRSRGVDELAGTGRGLQLVEALSSAWGIEQDGAGKVVWAVIEDSEHGAQAERCPRT